MTSSPSEDVCAAKALARRAGLAARDGLDAATRARLAARLVVEGRRLAAALAPGEAVSLFVAMRSEPDLDPLAQALHAAGRPLCLPVMQGKGQALIFRRWAPGQALAQARFGVREPSAEAALATPALLFVPLAAFDRDGARVGYGGGFYDRTLARLRASRRVLACGVAFAAQAQARVPVESTDEKLDMIVTETETLVFTRENS
ncbi:MAG: 5-formyltetrahydrofolate cyclo-ligase [Rhodoblastus sp.]|nr:MAG: 5-formyltetrahydrofolate cyclo-ligase [Rhodoblastus sp.]